MSRAVMQQALEALEMSHPRYVGQSDRLYMEEDRNHRAAITALREELAKPEQEPFGYFKAEPFGWVDCAETDDGAKALYEALRQRQPLTEEEIDVLAMDSDGTPNSHLEFARAIEAVHGIKG